MRAGALATHMSAFASPEFIVQSAQEAEKLGYHSIWVAERVLYPLKPAPPTPAPLTASWGARQFLAGESAR